MTGVGLKYGMTSIAAMASVMVAAPATAQTRNFNVPAQAAEKAIPLLAKQAGVPILASGKVVKGKLTRAVQGEHSVDEALAIMLEGTGLKVKRAGNGRGMITIVPASAAGNASGAANGGAEQVRGQAVLVGSVRDHKTGAALKGARVEVVETGDTTSTGDLGDFRFSRLPTGEVTLRVAYLGFPEQSEAVSVVGGLTNRTDIYLGSGATSEIVVYGQVSARAQALNQERTAENSSTVISADLLGNFQGTTISEALRRAPGVAFEQDPITGDGTKIIVRGLTPDYNQVQLNGQALLTAGNTGRSASLNNVLADSVSEVRISKTLLANQDSAGTGGLVEIETKSPLDRPNSFIRLGGEFSKRAGKYGDELLLTGTISQRFGASKNFGLSASVQYRRQNIANFSYNSFGQLGPYLPLDANGAPMRIADIDPRRPYPFEGDVDGYYLSSLSAGYSLVDSETMAVTLSAAWDWSDHTNLRLDYTRSDRKQSSDNASTFFDSGSSYALLPVPELNGAERYVLNANLNFAQAGFSASVNEQDEQTDTISFRGTSHFGRLTLDYHAGYNVSRAATPTYADLQLESRFGLTSDMVLPEAIDPRTGRITTLFGNRTGSGLPLPLFTAAGFAATDPSTSSNFSSASTAFDQRFRSHSWNGGASAKYEIGKVLRYIDLGLTYKKAAFRTTAGNREYYYGSYIPDGNGGWLPPSAERFGVGFFEAPFGRATGEGRSLQFIDPKTIAGVLARRDDLVGDGYLAFFEEGPNALLNQTRTKEGDLAAYAQARVDIGKLEIIGGVRMSRVTVDSVFSNQVQYIDENGDFDTQYALESLRLVSGSATQTDFLPRILANYRLSDKAVVRLGYFTAVARPQVQLLTSSQFINFNRRAAGGPNFDQPTLEIDTGNPGLKPAYTENFDFSAEYYSDDVGVLKLGLFYKKLHNLLESNAVSGLDNIEGFDLPDNVRFQNLPDNLFVVLRTPTNNPDVGKIWGLEASIEKRLSFLPGALGGLGIYANYTYTKSRKTIMRSWFTKPVVDANGNVTRVQEDYLIKGAPFAGQPPHSGTIGLTYTGKGVDASIMYSYQARRLDSPGNFGLDYYTEASDTLDMRLSYKFALLGADAQFYLEGNNLLKGARDASVETTIGGRNGVPRYSTGGFFIGGRAVTGGLTITF